MLQALQPPTNVALYCGGQANMSHILQISATFSGTKVTLQSEMYVCPENPLHH